MGIEELFTQFEFIIPGTVSLGLTVVVALIITRDMKKVKLLLFPLSMATASLGFPTNPVFMIVLAILFIQETFTFGVLTDYLAQIRVISK